MQYPVDYTKGEIDQQRNLCHSALRTLNGYIRYIRVEQQGKQEYGEQVVREEQSAIELTNLATD
jgi:hypothetical protein